MASRVVYMFALSVAQITLQENKKCVLYIVDINRNMSPIIRRYCFCSFVIIALILYIFYTQLTSSDLNDLATAHRFAEIGYTQSPLDDIDSHANHDRTLVNLTNFEYKITPKCVGDVDDQTISGMQISEVILIVPFFVILNSIK